MITSFVLRNAEFAVEFFGPETTLDQIDTNWLDAYVDHLAKGGNADSTINRKIAALSKVFTVAMKRDGARSKPDFPRQKETEGRIRFLTEEEEGECLATLRQWSQEDAHDLFSVLIDTGMRIGSESMTFPKRDVDLDQGIITLWDTKNSKPRSIPMTSRVRKIMVRRIAGISDNERVFDFSYQWVRSWWARLRTKMGMTYDEQFVPHALGSKLNQTVEWLRQIRFTSS